MNKKVLTEILNIDKVICNNIDQETVVERGLLSQNILSQLRNLVEDISVLIYNKKYNADLDNHYDSKKTAYNDLYTTCNPRFLMEFHKYLKHSKSHYTPDYDGAERLMIKYYYYLVKIKDYMKNNFAIDILKNIEKFPIDRDTTFYDYYEKVAIQLENVFVDSKIECKNERYYVQKIKPFFVGIKIYYEVTLTNTTDNVNKFDRMVLFTKCEIMPNYSIIISCVEKEIDLFEGKTTIKIINNWNVAIRSCEINNLGKILGENITVKSNYGEYNNMMKYLTNKNMNLLDLVMMPNEMYKSEKLSIGTATTDYIFKVIERARKIVLNNEPGVNIIKYLLFIMNNLIIKFQYGRNDAKEYLSNLYLDKKCFAFEKMPFFMSLAHHNPKGENLFLSINADDREHELLARYIRRNTEEKGVLYTPLNELSDFENLDLQIELFNRRLHTTQQDAIIKKEHNYIYMEGYEKNSVEIINILKELSNQGLRGYKESYKFWEETEGQNIVIEKKEILRKLYETSQVALIYGAAGTGKTTLINYFSDFFSEKKKICLANTNTAVENLRRKIKSRNTFFYTIAEFLSYSNFDKDCDVLIIDECSTVSNRFMIDTLRKANFELLMLVGDVYQIESIRFGNWFNLAREFVPEHAKFELKETFRSSNSKLLELWNKVRSGDLLITEFINNNCYASQLNKDILSKTDDDEIILCLSYDGLYGINQINKYLQDNNPNDKVEFGINSYKVGDPILFMELKRFSPTLYNNLKGVVKKIENLQDKIWFEIEIEKPLTSLDISNSDIELLSTGDHFSLIRFYVNKELENDDDDENNKNTIPFNIAYALSIHKAQGLEYNSVKVVITNDVDEMISSNIFYTAITRAKEKLKIYWTPESQERIMEKIKEKKDNKDQCIIKQKYNL